MARLCRARVASYRVTNFGTDDPAPATTIIEVTQAANMRSKADKTYHLVFSFPPDEPLFDVLHAIGDELCEAIGYADHQHVSAVHIARTICMSTSLSTRCTVLVFKTSNRSMKRYGPWRPANGSKSRMAYSH